jgi:asparagine synthase (glutamine-hydrolysing)
MCGLNFTPVTDVIESMNRALSHRGLPGREHARKVGDLHFGHVRLPVQGLDKKFDQPYEYGNSLFLFTGEIFNYKKLNPTADSDVQVLAEMWTDIGELCFQYFDGFWACVIYDSSDRRVHILTDHLGKKPLYMHKRTHSVSSEIKALRLLEGGKEALDPMYFSSVEKWGYHIGPHTMFSGIEKIPPRTHIILHSLTLEKLSQEIYLNLEPWGIGDPVPDIRRTIEEAVENRLVSDLPVSILLSGGLDSTIIFELAKRRTKNLMAFHIDNDESEYLEHIDFEGVPLKTLRLEEADLSTVLRYNEGPVDLGSMLPQYQLSRAISNEGYRVAMSGDGADELFGGYRRIDEYDSQYSDVFEELVYYHLPRLDKLMMANTVELRNPFLAVPVIRTALKLTLEMRTHKKILKDVFSNLVPKAIIDRPKEPLKSPQVRQHGLEWIRHLSKLCKEEIQDERR